MAFLKTTLASQHFWTALVGLTPWTMFSDTAAACHLSACSQAAHDKWQDRSYSRAKVKEVSRLNTVLNNCLFPRNLMKCGTMLSLTWLSCAQAAVNMSFPVLLSRVLLLCRWWRSHPICSNRLLITSGAALCLKGRLSVADHILASCFRPK